MNSHTQVILFPGTDAIQETHLRLACWEIKEIRDKILYVQQNFLADSHLDLVSIMQDRSDVENSTHWFQELVLASYVCQTVLYDKLKLAMPTNNSLHLGVSLGDIARTVCVGAADFEKSFECLHAFVLLCQKYTVANTYLLRFPYSIEAIADKTQFPAYQIYPAVIQNERFVLAVATEENIKNWQQEVGKSLSAKVRFMYPFPLHSPYMEGIQGELKPYIEAACRLPEPYLPVFSTISCQQIYSNEQIVTEGVLNAYSPILFLKAIQNLFTEYETIEFLNLGPAPTLLRFIELMELPKDRYKCIDLFKDSLVKNRVP